MEINILRNIGNEIERKLHCVGICSAEELIQIGSKQAFLRLKSLYPNVCIVHLYTLQGAIDNIDYNRLSAKTKQDLIEFYKHFN